MKEVVIRKAVAKDLETLLQFEQGVIEAERAFDPTLKNSGVVYYDIKRMIEADHIEVLVAVADGKTIASGYARIEDSELYLQHRQHAYLGFMYVLPEFRGRGINRMIVEKLRSWAGKQGITELRLEVYHKNEGAIKAYEKAGFSQHMIEMRLGL